MTTESKKQKLLRLTDNLDNPDPQAIDEAIALLVSIRDNSEVQVEKVRQLSEARSHQKIQDLEGDIGSHTVGRIIEFFILYSLMRLERAKTKLSLLSILKKAGIPQAFEEGYEKALNTRLHRMTKDLLIEKINRSGTITFANLPAGTQMMHDMSGDSGDPVIDDYLTMMQPDVDSAIETINRSGIRLG